MLTDLECKNAKPGERAYKMTDGGGLHLFVTTKGAKVWRWKYRIGGREKLLTIGRYPKVTPKAARTAREAARRQLEVGIDPSGDKKVRRQAALSPELDTFEQAARAWHATKSVTLTERYADAVLSRLEANAFPLLGAKGLREITPPMVLEVIRVVEDRGANDMAHRVRNHISDVFVWAIASGLAEQDPAAVIRKALAPTDPRLRPAMVKLAKAREVLTKTEKLPGAHWSTLLASRLLALTAARPGVVRLAEEPEFEDLDGDQPLWRIPAAKMKLTRARKRDVTWEFVVPLSKQAAAVVRAAIASSQACLPDRDKSIETPRWLFTGVGGWRRPMSDSTLSKLYRDAGFTGVHVPHGWRATFSTIMNERAAHQDRERDRAIIDLMLAHVQDGVEPIYNRAAYMPRRRELAQDWADLLMKGVGAPEGLLPDVRPWRAREPKHDGPGTGARRPRNR